MVKSDLAGWTELPRHDWGYGGDLITPDASWGWAGTSHRSMDAVGAALSGMADVIVSDKRGLTSLTSV